MEGGALERLLADEAATRRFGEDLAAVLKPGDVVALSGDLGAGKTALARAVIRALADDPALEVPSPTFTLVQPYEGRLPVLHVDLYRIAHADEADELGLDEAASGVVLVEWPERAGGRFADAAFRVALEHAGEGRLARISGAGACRLARSLEIRDFLARQGWEEARRRFLLGDASTRAYETVTLPDHPVRILMDAPPRPDGPPVRGGKPYSRIAHLAESVTPFVAVARLLREAGFAAPEIHAADLDRGLLLIEHLGSEGLLDAEGRPVAERYEAAAETLAAIHARRWPAWAEAAPGVVHAIPSYDRDALAIETELVTDWYIPYVTGAEADRETREAFAAAWDRAFDRLEQAEKSIVLRDYHSPNIIWRGERSGLDRIGIIDFQDAVIGPAAYDVASLAQDARVTIAPDLEARIVGAYAAARERAGGFDRAGFEEAYAIMAAQRNAKILGIFVRLDRRDGKPHYLKHLPRIRDYLRRALRHPALDPVRAACERAGLVPVEGV